MDVRFEEEDKMAKTIENQRLLKEAEEVRKIAAARKNAEAARLRCGKADTAAPLSTWLDETSTILCRSFPDSHRPP